MGGHEGARERTLSPLSQVLAFPMDPSIQARGGAPILIMGQLYLKQSVDIGALRAVVRDRLMSIPRFRCVVYEDEKEKLYKLQSVEVGDIELQYHVCVPEKEGKWSDGDVDAFCSSVYVGEGSYKLDYKRPPLRIFVMEKDDGRTLVLLVLDHVLADGVSAVAALMNMFDKSDVPASPPTKRSAGPNIPLASKIRSYVGGLSSLLDPVWPADHMTKLKEPDHRYPSKHKACAKGGKIPLAEMKRIKEKFPGATINDVMLATLTLTLQRYYAEQGEPLKEIRGCFPINLRDPKQDVLTTSVGNKIVNANFVLPMGEKDPVKLVWLIKRQVDTIKYSPGALIMFKIQEAMIPKQMAGGMRSQLFDQCLDSYGKVTAMLSNVPGPSAEVSLCGQVVDDLMFYCFAGMGCYLGMLSYNGGVNLGIVCSAKTEPEPANIARHWVPAFQQLVHAVDAAKPGKEQFAKPSYTGDLVVVSAVMLCFAFLIHRLSPVLTTTPPTE